MLGVGSPPRRPNSRTRSERRQTMKRLFSLLLVPVIGIALSMAVPTASAQEEKKDEKKKTGKKKGSKKKKKEGAEEKKS